MVRFRVIVLVKGLHMYGGICFKIGPVHVEEHACPTGPEFRFNMQAGEATDATNQPNKQISSKQ